MITRMDRDIGRLLDLLKKLGLDRKTIVFFSSDNGPHREGGHNPNYFDSNGPLRGIKRDLYEGGIRVPTIARWPGKIKPGVVSDQPWAFWDFLPTACELAGVESPRGIDGISIVPTLLGGNERGYHQAVRMGDWKAVRHGPRGKIELYDLATDLGERNNIADRHPDIVARIARIMAEARTDNPHFPVPKPRPLKEKKA